MKQAKAKGYNIGVGFGLFFETKSVKLFYGMMQLPSPAVVLY
jgi:hypothetical protein